MALGWLTGTRELTLPELIAQKKYGRAVELLRAQFQQGSHDPRLRMQLADVLDAAGRKQEAIPIYLGLADEFAREGFIAKAIAVLKKLQRIEPGRRDVEKRLAHLATERRQAPTLGSTLSTLSGSQEIGMEEIGLEPHSISMEAAPPSAPPVSISEAEIMLEPEPAATPQGDLLAGVVTSAGPAVESESTFEEEFFDTLAETVKASEASATQAAAAGGAATAAPVKSPLFGDFTEEELLAVMVRLDLLSCEAGDILISEGEPGDSLFVLTTGVVKAFVRNPAGRHVLVREMSEGSFFGEISILSGKPRSATVTCATHCELLELNREALDAITQTHPRVQQVLLDFYRQRHGSGEEKLVRGMAFGKAAQS